MLGAIPAAIAADGEADSIDLFRDGARHAPARPHEGCTPAMAAPTCARNDQMVRHQLSLHGARADAGQGFALTSAKAIDEFREAKALGYHTRPVLLGPVTWLSSPRASRTSTRFAAADAVLPVYAESWRSCAMRAPTGCRSTSRCPGARPRRRSSARALPGPMPGRRVRAEADADHLFRRAGRQSGLRARRCRWRGCMSIWSARPSSSMRCSAARAEDLLLSLGVVDGRNVWRSRSRRAARQARTGRGDARSGARAVLLAAPRAGRSGARKALDPRWPSGSPSPCRRSRNCRHSSALVDGRDERVR
jgi:5-methyltetrahydropteroyltriglutamate--homocysteine methyltransferase